MAQDIHQIVTDKIIATMEAGEQGSWQCPWHRRGGGLPRNALTGKAYRGINTLSLWVGAQAAGYSDDRWATYKQWAELGAQVKRGERSTLVIFWKDLGRDEEEDRPRFVARASYAFNAAQVEGAPEAGEPMPPSEWCLPEIFDGFVERTGARVLHGGDAAFYQPGEDRIVMPPRDRFQTAQGYASTMAHELTLRTQHRPQRRTTERFAEVLDLLHHSVCRSQTGSPSAKADDDAPQLTPSGLPLCQFGCRLRRRSRTQPAASMLSAPQFSSGAPSDMRPRLVAAPQHCKPT